MSHLLEFSHGSVTLNEEQYKVVTSPISENQRILASAGSGKTTRTRRTRRERPGFKENRTRESDDR